MARIPVIDLNTMKVINVVSAEPGWQPKQPTRQAGPEGGGIGDTFDPETASYIPEKPNQTDPLTSWNETTKQWETDPKKVASYERKLFIEAARDRLRAANRANEIDLMDIVIALELKDPT